jgi:plastocyanin
MLLVGLVAITFQAPPAWSAEGEVIIRATALEPPVLRAGAGQRVTFVKHVNRPVHVEFGVDPSAHQVFQMPATGPIWAIFHRPGTHPYVVHIYDGKTIVLHGLIEVVEDPDRPWGLGRCGAVVMEVCIEP